MPRGAIAILSFLLAAGGTASCATPQQGDPVPAMAAPPPPQSNRWKTVSVANNVRLAIDTATLLRPSEERALVWTRQDYVTGASDLRTKVALLEIRCNDAAYRELKVSMYGRMGELNASTDAPSAEWIHLPAASIYEELVNTACQ